MVSKPEHKSNSLKQESMDNKPLPYQVYLVEPAGATNTDANNSEKLSLTFVQDFETIGKASQFLRAPEFLAILNTKKPTQVVILSTHHQYSITPITLLEQSKQHGQNNLL